MDFKAGKKILLYILQLGVNKESITLNRLLGS